MANQSATSSQQSEKPNGKPPAPAVDENQPIGSLSALNAALGKWAPQLSNVSPYGQKFDFQRFKAIVMACASRTPKIVLCSYYSIRQAVNSASELGLELGGVSGEAFLIPYENRKKLYHPNGRCEWITVLEAQFIPGYKGFLRLAHESGLFRDLGCSVILPDDDWQPIRKGPEKLQWGHVQNEPKTHPAKKIPAARWDDSAKAMVDYEASIAPLRGAYAYAKLKDPASDDIVRPIWFDRLEAIRLRSKAGKNGPWITDYHEMAQKTAVRNLWKHIPKTDRMKLAEALDQEFDLEDAMKDARQERTPEIITVTEQPASADAAKAKTDRVADRVGRKNEEQKAAAAPPAPPSSRPANEPPNHDGDAPSQPVVERDPQEPS